MQISAAFLAAKEIFRKSARKQYRLSYVIIPMACVLLIGSFFYSLLYLLVFKTSLSPVASFSFLQPLAPAVWKITPIKPSFAQEIVDPDLTLSIENLICQDLNKNISLSNPEIETLKTQKLCPGKNSSQTLDLALEKEINPENPLLKEQLTTILGAKPMASMIEPISQQDKIVAAFLVGIALKESALGVHAPHKNGVDCHNYWGYRGKENATASGYSCFDSPEHAVQVVGGRLKTLVEKNITTPSQMVVWKCGSKSCTGHAPSSVTKWIQDVSLYFHQINNS